MQSNDLCTTSLMHSKKGLIEKLGSCHQKSKQEMGTMTPEDVAKAVITNHPVQLIAHNSLPFTEVLQFSAIRTLLDNVAMAKRNHIIDLSIKCGQQGTVFLQGPAARHTCLIESVKISAVGGVEDLIFMTGKRLSSFAESLSLPSNFKQVKIPDIK